MDSRGSFYPLKTAFQYTGFSSHCQDLIWGIGAKYTGFGYINKEQLVSQMQRGDSPYNPVRRRGEPIQEFLQPPEEKSVLPTLPTQGIQQEENLEPLIAEIEKLSQSAKKLTKQSTWVFFITFFIPTAILVGISLLALNGHDEMLDTLNDFLFLHTHKKYQPILTILPSLLLAHVLSMLVLRKRSFQNRLSDLVAKIEQFPHPRLAPHLLRFIQKNQQVPTKVFLPFMNTLLLKVSDESIVYFQKPNVYTLNVHLQLWNFSLLKSSLLSPFAVLNALKYVGNEESARIMRQLLKKRPTTVDAEKERLYGLIEEALPIIEARVLKESGHSTLLRPSQPNDDNTLLRPSQEQAEPAQELLRSSEKRE